MFVCFFLSRLKHETFDEDRLVRQPGDKSLDTEEEEGSEDDEEDDSASMDDGDSDAESEEAELDAEDDGDGDDGDEAPQRRSRRERKLRFHSFREGSLLQEAFDQAQAVNEQDRLMREHSRLAHDDVCCKQKRKKE